MKSVSLSLLVFATGILFPAVGLGGLIRTAPDDPKKGLRSAMLEDIRLDGRMDDWPSGLFYIGSGIRAMYAVANDRDHLYFCLQLTEESGQMSALHRGVKVWIDPSGKKREKSSLRISAIPVRPESRGGENPGATRQTFEGPGGKKMILRSPANQPLTGRLEATGWRNGYAVTVPIPGPDTGFAAAMAFDSSGVLVIEGMIPLSALTANPLEAKALSFGFGIEGSAREGGEGRGPDDQRAGGPPGGMEPGQGMGGGMNQGMEGRAGGGRPGGMEQRPGIPSGGSEMQMVKSWHRFTLAPAPAVK